MNKYILRGINPVKLMTFHNGYGIALRGILFCVCSLLIAAAPGCGPKAEPAPPNVLLIVIDTLRADHLGCYGYGRDTSPNIDRFSRTGVLFENAYCQMPTTGPSHASIFTSQYPRSHGVLKNGWTLSGTYPTLAEILRENGYATAAVVSSFALSSEFGYARGFDYYDEQFTPEGSTMPADKEWEGHAVKGGFDQRADVTTRKATNWLGQNDGKPFFLWVHYFDPHWPYSPPEPHAKRFIADGQTPTEQLIARYDGEVRLVDEEIGKLLDFVKAKKLDSNTLIIIMSDHGEGLGDHGFMKHGKLLYDEQTRVPLIMSLPGVIPENMRLDVALQSTDILPTVIDLLGLELKGNSSGHSLLKTIRKAEQPSDHIIFLERRNYAGSTGPETGIVGNKFAVRQGNMKYIWAPEEGAEDLYNLAEDPGELTNIVDRDPKTAGKMQDMIRHWMEEQGKVRHQRIDDRARQKLEALGYIE